MFCASLTAQTVNRKIDDNNGFLEFKFGTSPTQFAGKIQKSTAAIQNNKTSRYKVVSNEYKKVFGYDVNQIDLEFYNNRLYAITIDFIEESNDVAYSYILFKLTNIFGESSANIQLPTGTEYFEMLKGEAWFGSRSTLYLHKIKKKSSGKIFASIYYKDKQLEKELEGEEF